MPHQRLTNNVVSTPVVKPTNVNTSANHIAANARVMKAARDAGVPIVLPDKTAFVPAPDDGGDNNSNSNSGGDDA